MADVETSFSYRFSSTQDVEGEIGVFRIASRLEVGGVVGLYRISDKSIWDTFTYRVSSRKDVFSDWVYRISNYSPVSVATNNESPFEWARKTGDGHPSVSLYSDSGDISDLCPHTIVLSGQESTTGAMNIQLIDNRREWHPYSSGAYADRLVDDAEVALIVTLGGVSKVFCATMASPSGGQPGGPSSAPQLTWPGLGPGNKLFGAKRDLETLGGIGESTGLTNKQILQEVCELVEVDCDWSRIRSILIHGPYHRQQLTPAQIATQILDETVDNWRENGSTIEGYDPESGGRHWDYTSDEQVYTHTFAPAGNTVYDKVIGLRLIATGKLVPSGEDAAYVEVDEFREYTIPLPSLSAVTTSIEYRDPRGGFSGFQYKTPTGTVLRQPRLNARYSEAFTTGPIVGATEVTFSWGAAHDGVTRAGVTEAKGAINFHGTPFFKGETETQPPTDMTTRYETPGGGNSPLELRPTPLLSGKADLKYKAEKMLRMVRYKIINHTLEVPLNHLVQVGDTISFRLAPMLGGRVIGPLPIYGWEHVIKRKKTTSTTTLKIREYLGK